MLKFPEHDYEVIQALNPQIFKIVLKLHQLILIINSKRLLTTSKRTTIIWFKKIKVLQ